MSHFRSYGIPGHTENCAGGGNLGLRRDKILEFIASTDWHLDGWKRFFPNNDLAVRAQIAEIRKPFDYAVAKGVQRVFICGDIGEYPHLSPEAHYHLLELLLEFDGILIIDIILGNHDFAVEGLNNLASFQQLQEHGKFKTVRFHVKGSTEVLGGIQVNFMPYPLTKPPKSDRPSINLAHIEIPGGKRDNGRVVKDTEGVDIRKSSKDQWVIGHFHTPQEGENWLYLGTVIQKNFGEKLPKGWWHCRCDEITDDGGVWLNFRKKFIENTPKITLHTVEINEPDDYSNVSQDLNMLYKIKLSRGVPMNSTVHGYPNVVDYELVGDASSYSGLDEEELKTAKVFDNHSEDSLDPTAGLHLVLVNTLETVEEVELGMQMARAAAQRAFDVLGAGAQ